MNENKLYSELHHDAFQELYISNSDTQLQNLRGTKIDVKFLTSTKSSVCIAHQLTTSLPHTHACIIFKIETPGFKYLHKIQK